MMKKKKKNQNKCYRVCAERTKDVQKTSTRSWTSSERLMFVQFTSCVYGVLKHMLTTNQYVAKNYCLMTTLLWRIFTLRVFKTEKLWKIQCEDCSFPVFIKRVRKMFIYPGNMCESKKRIKIL